MTEPTEQLTGDWRDGGRLDANPEQPEPTPSHSRHPSVSGQTTACGCAHPTEQPNTNAMIFEQANGSIKVTVELLEQLETKDTHQETMKHGCIWTLKGWWENNLKHLQSTIK